MTLLYIIGLYIAFRIITEWRPIGFGPSENDYKPEEFTYDWDPHEAIDIDHEDVTDDNTARQ